MKKETYVKRELVGLLQGIIAVEDLKGAKFASTVLKNRALVADVLKDVEDKALPSKEFLALAQEMQQFDHEKEVDKVKAKEEEPENKKIIDERRSQMNNIETLLDDTIDVQLFKMTESHLPRDITLKQLEGIKLIVK